VNEVIVDCQLPIADWRATNGTPLKRVKLAIGNWQSEMKLWNH
jgi:hypothetical protein